MPKPSPLIAILAGMSITISTAIVAIAMACKPSAPTTIPPHATTDHATYHLARPETRLTNADGSIVINIALWEKEGDTNHYYLQSRWADGTCYYRGVDR